MNQEEIKVWLWQHLSPFGNQFEIMDELTDKLEKYSESIRERAIDDCIAVVSPKEYVKLLKIKK